MSRLYGLDQLLVLQDSKGLKVHKEVKVLKVLMEHKVPQGH